MVKKTFYFSPEDVELLDDLQQVERRRRGKRITLSELVSEAVQEYARKRTGKTA